jgi:hypothetical protein
MDPRLLSYQASSLSNGNIQCPQETISVKLILTNRYSLEHTEWQIAELKFINKYLPLPSLFPPPKPVEWTSCGPKTGTRILAEEPWAHVRASIWLQGLEKQRGLFSSRILETLHLNFNLFCILLDVIGGNYPSQNSQRPRARIPKPRY